jgi:hypothetical protein
MAIVSEDKARLQLLSDVYADIHKEAGASEPYHGQSTLTGEQTPTDMISRYLAQKLRPLVQAPQSVIAGARAFQLYVCYCHQQRRLSTVQIREEFYREVLSKLLGLGFSPVDPEQLSGYVLREVSLVGRFCSVASRFGWMMLAILAFSANFRQAAITLDEASWEAFADEVGRNTASLQLFAKARCLPWKAVLDSVRWGPPLTAADIRSDYEFSISHPHEWFVPLHSAVPQRCVNVETGEPQISIDESVFDAGGFGGAFPERPPRGWPRLMPWPGNPMLIPPSARTPCPFCGVERCSTCCPAAPGGGYLNPLVEIVECSQPGMDRSVRALQRIPHHSYLAEYAGELITHRELNTSDPNAAYALSSTNSVAVVQASRRGNWTRYMNHSCNATCIFTEVWTGGRSRTLVRAVRDIEPFEQLTVDYGAGYWSRTRLCLCGEPNCRYDTWQKITEVRLGIYRG